MRSMQKKDRRGLPLDRQALLTVMLQQTSCMTCTGHCCILCAMHEVQLPVILKALQASAVAVCIPALL